MSVIQMGEVLYTAERERGEKARQMALKALKYLGVQFVGVDATLAVNAAHYKARGGIAYPDCFAVALAKLKRAVLVTKDKEFKKFSDDVKIEWLE